MRDISDASREAARQWLIEVTQQTGKSLTRIATEAKVAVSTLTRAVNDPEHPHTLSAATISKIAAATGIPAPSFLSENKVVRLAFQAPEADPYRFDDGRALDPLVRALLAGRNAADAWVLRTRALELAGYMPGDIVAVDMAVTPASGDVVIAQVYDFDRGRADTVWRIYEPPYLVAASMDRSNARPLRDDAVQIKGVVVGLFRPRQGTRVA